MKTSNLSNNAIRQSEVGHAWVERLTNATGTLYVPKLTTFRVRSVTAGTTVTIDGVLAMTMAAGEIAVFNVGLGDANYVPSAPNMSKSLVEIKVQVNNAFLQIAADSDIRYYANIVAGP
jgi:hypothetical protein